MKARKSVTTMINSNILQEKYGENQKSQKSNQNKSNRKNNQWKTVNFQRSNQ